MFWSLDCKMVTSSVSIIIYIIWIFKELIMMLVVQHSENYSQRSFQYVAKVSFTTVRKSDFFEKNGQHEINFSAICS